MKTAKLSKITWSVCINCLILLDMNDDDNFIYFSFLKVET
jgi:hypothetical protein